jgi:F-type H+-transporting ATPase subunit delta
MTDAREYGKALFLLTEEAHTTEECLGDVNVLKALIAENEGYAKLLDTPALTKEERLDLITKSFGSLNPYLVNLIKILASARMAYQLDKAIEGYTAAYDEARGIERVEAVTAVAMTNEQLAAMKSRLTALTGKTIIIKNTIDPTILGGVKLRYSGLQLDGSVKTRLDGFEKSLKEIVIS